MFDWVKEWFLEISRQVIGSSVYLAAPLMILVGAIDSSLLSFPEVNDYITVARIVNNPAEVYYFPLFPAVGSVIGCVVLYRIARRGEQFVARRFNPRHLARVKELYQRWGLWALVIPALLPPPIPFKIFVAAAGALGYPIARFAIVVMAARTARYYFWGIIAFFFRNEVRKMMDWLGHNIISVLGVSVAAFAFFMIVRWMMSRWRGQSAKGKAQVSYTD
jgi:membrane protein YqaA with SNARE-associated domain